MQFVFPNFLWALLAIAIPIAIHLFNFRRVKRVYFSNVRLLQEVKTETNSFRRLKQFLIMLSRIGFVIFLVFAFAQPYIPSKNQKNIKNLSALVSVYLDNSFSMQSELGNDNYFDLGSRYISDLLRVFPKESKFQLITNSFENKEQYPVTAKEVEDRLTETNFSNAYRDLPSIYKRQFSLLERYSRVSDKNQVFWFSDFQKSTIGDINKIKLDSNNQYYIVPIKSSKTPNIMIDSVWLENPFIKSLESNQINVRLKSFNEETFPDLTLKLSIDNQQVSTTTIDLPAKATVTANFNFTVSGKGFKPCKITFEDFPVTFDNEYYFVIDASPKVNILHLYDNKSQNYIENVYDNESVFDVNSFNVNNLDYNRIKTAELIILNGVESIAGELSTNLQEFVRNGGSLAVFPSKKSDKSFTSLMNSLTVSGFKNKKIDKLKTGKSAELALLNINNPFYQGVFDKVPSNMNMPFANAVNSWNNLGENLLTFKNRKPFLSKFQVQKGKVYVFASPLNPKYSNFPKHAIFVPIMYKMASASKSIGKRPAYTFQEKTIRLKVSKPSKDQVYKLVKGDLEIVPTQRLVGDELVLDLPEQNLEAGYYKLKLNNSKKTENLLALNYGKAESEMSFYSLEDIKSAFSKNKNVQIYDFSQGADFIQAFKDKNIRRNLWKYALIIALGFLLIEIALIRLL